MTARSAAIFCGAIFILACPPLAMAQSGIASVYGYDGQKTASGERASSRGMTAAHRTLPFGTRVIVTDPKTQRSVEVTVNDRGPFTKRYVIDLSYAAAQALQMTDRGLMKVTAAVQ